MGLIGLMGLIGPIGPHLGRAAGVPQADPNQRAEHGQRAPAGAADRAPDLQRPRGPDAHLFGEILRAGREDESERQQQRPEQQRPARRPRPRRQQQHGGQRLHQEQQGKVARVGLRAEHKNGRHQNRPFQTDDGADGAAVGARPVRPVEERHAVPPIHPGGDGGGGEGEDASRCQRDGRRPAGPGQAGDAAGDRHAELGRDAVDVGRPRRPDGDAHQPEQAAVGDRLVMEVRVPSRQDGRQQGEAHGGRGERPRGRPAAPQQQIGEENDRQILNVEGEAEGHARQPRPAVQEAERRGEQEQHEQVRLPHLQLALELVGDEEDGEQGDGGGLPPAGGQAEAAGELAHCEEDRAEQQGRVEDEQDHGGGVLRQPGQRRVEEGEQRGVDVAAAAG